MRFHLVTVEETEQFGDQWTIAPLVRLQDMSEHAPGLMMPMAGEEVELRLPDGGTKTAHIVSFGVSLWKDSEGNFYTNSDLTDPSLTLTIKCDPDVKGIPPGTQIWLPNATFDAASEDS